MQLKQELVKANTHNVAWTGVGLSILSTTLLAAQPYLAQSLHEHLPPVVAAMTISLIGSFLTLIGRGPQIAESVAKGRVNE